MPDTTTSALLHNAVPAATTIMTMTANTVAGTSARIFFRRARDRTTPMTPASATTPIVMPVAFWPCERNPVNAFSAMKLPHVNRVRHDFAVATAAQAMSATVYENVACW